MANTVKLKRSAVQGKVPQVADLQLGELALNTHDGKLYTKRDNGAESVVEIGGGGGGGLAAQALTHSAGTITWDVSAGRWGDFEADVFLPSEVSLFATSTGTISAPLPAGLQQNDFVLVFTGGTASDDADVAESGWTQIDRIFVGNGAEKAQIHYKRMGATPDSGSINHSAHADADVSYTTNIAVFRGVDPATAFDAAYVEGADANGTSSEPGAITTVTENALVLPFLFKKDTQAVTLPAGYAEAFSQSPGASYAIGAHLAQKQIAAAGLEDPGVFSWAGSEDHASGILALRPQNGSGERDYTLAFANLPALLTPLVGVFEIKTDTGTWDFSAVDEWVGGAAPTMDSVGKHLIRFYASASRVVGEYVGALS